MGGCYRPGASTRYRPTGYGSCAGGGLGVVSRSGVVVNSAGQHATWLHVTSGGLLQVAVGRDVSDVIKTWGAVELKDQEAETGQTDEE